MRNILVAQSGGPTAAINATLCGVLEKARDLKFDNIYAARYGIKGLLKGDILNLNFIKKEDLELLKTTPSSILGSCRYKLKDFDEGEEEYEQIVKILREHEIGYFIYIGGNDSMDTVEKFSRYLKYRNITDIFMVGAPKTIDNDLEETDHCPGFASAAKYIATTFKELERDTAVYDVKSVTIVETMGRDAGWLTAASCLSKGEDCPGPSLVYCCERAFSVEGFLEEVEGELKAKNNILVAVSEGIKNEKNELISSYVSKDKKDMFGHSNNAGVAKFLEEVVRKEIGIKVRSVELNICQRAASHLASYVDIEESFNVGKKAVELLNEEKSGVMVTIERKEQKEYEVCYSCSDVFNVANRVKKMPENFILKERAYITEEAYLYLQPLILGEVKLKYKDGVPLFFKF